MAFKYSRLVKFSRVIRRDSAGLEICFRDKEVTNIYDMFYARMMLHKKAYQHKVAKVIDTMWVFMKGFRYSLKYPKITGKDPLMFKSTLFEGWRNPYTIFLVR